MPGGYTGAMRTRPTDRRVSFVLLAALMLAGCKAAPEPAADTDKPASAETGATDPESGLPVVPLTIRGRGKPHDFHVEVAGTPQEQAKGLMFRTGLAPDAGMIFPFDPPREASFWMRNTVISLDLVFVKADGTIESIAANAEPYSERPIRSQGPVAAVLEIAGGRAAELGLKPGDRVDWQAP